MKLLAFILAIYIVALPCIPCPEEKDRCNEVQRVNQQNHADNPHEDDAQACNPFCNCTCCHQFFPVYFQISNRSEKTFDRQQFSSPISHNFVPAGYCGNIWQPPRTDS